jgi:hypothetical protein
MTAIAGADAARRAAVTTNQRFYVRIAYACAAVAVLGFAPTYWIPLLSGGLELAPITHLHAIVFYGWLTLLIVQTRLAASRQLVRHRELGVLGVAVATAMCFVGTGAAVQSVRQAQAAGFGDAGLAFSVVPLSGIVFFAALFTLALVNVKRLDVHKRLILVATISLLQAAVGRVFLLALGADPPTAATTAPPPVFVTVVPGLVSDLLLVWAMLHDKRTLGHVHRVYWAAGAALLVLQVIRIPIAETDAWTSIARFVLTLVP